MQRKVDQGVEQDHVRSEGPWMPKRPREGEDHRNDEDRKQRQPAFGCPLRPVVMRVVDALASIEAGVARIHRFKRAHAEAGPWTFANHLQSGHKEFAPVAERVLVVEAAQERIPTDDGGRDPAAD